MYTTSFNGFASKSTSFNGFASKLKEICYSVSDYMFYSGLTLNKRIFDRRNDLSIKNIFQHFREAKPLRKRRTFSKETFSFYLQMKLFSIEGLPSSGRSIISDQETGGSFSER